MSPRPATLSGDRAEPVPFRRTTQAASVTVAALALLLGPGVGFASAHDTLIGSDPADGAMLDEVPGTVVLTFSSDQLDVGAAVAVTGPDGTAWADGAPTVDGPTVTQALVPQMPSGAYAVEWRSVSSDGHPISGALAFTLDLPAPVTAPAPTAEAEPATPDPTAEPEVEQATPTAEPAAVDDHDATADGERSDGMVGGPWAAVALAVAAAAGVATLVVLRRRAANVPEDPRE